MLLEILTIITNAVVLSVVGYGTFKYIKIKRSFQEFKKRVLKMNAEELLRDLELPEQNASYETHVNDREGIKRERLLAIVAGGNSKQYIGKDLQLSDINTMPPEEINKLYCRYEARLGASMTKTLGNSFINLYVMGVSKYFNVTNPPKLIQDLEEDPFINNALTSTCCELYYRYGMYLAPFTAMLTTARHIDFNKENKSENNDIENDE